MDFHYRLKNVRAEQNNVLSYYFQKIASSYYTFYTEFHRILNNRMFDE